MKSWVRSPGGEEKVGQSPYTLVPVHPAVIGYRVSVGGCVPVARGGGMAVQVAKVTSDPSHVCSVPGAGF